MNYKDLEKRALKRMKDWNETKPNKREYEDFLLSEIFEQAPYINDKMTINALLQEMAGYILNLKEGQAEQNQLIVNISEWHSELLEEVDE